MLVDLDVKKKKAFIVGGGREAELKALKLSDAGASVTVIARRFTAGLRDLSRTEDVSLVETDPSQAGPLIRSAMPKVLFISTGKAILDAELARFGHSMGILVCVVDGPEHNDFNMPAIAKVGTLRVAISSGGKSPAMVKILRKRIEKLIGPEDLLQIELQQLVRKQISSVLGTPAARKKMVYEIIEDDEVARLLKKGDLGAAQVRARKMIRVRGRSKKRN